MVAVVFSGSHLAHWRLADGDETIATFKTQGINPYFNDEKFILGLLNKNINLIHHAEEIKKIHFFTPGATSAARTAVVNAALSKFFRNAKITVCMDLLGAAIATYKQRKGIICILGSGSNAAYYDGKKIRPNNYGLGYILADEGGANWLGIQLLKTYVSETMPDAVQTKFSKRYDLDKKQILEKVYHHPNPALFLSSFNDFFIENRENDFIKNLVKTGFYKFISTYLVPLLSTEPDADVCFVGSLAAGFSDYLNEVSSEFNINIAGVIKDPINNLLNYYTNKH